MDGIVSADGAGNTYVYGGSGSAGSLWVAAGNLTGAGRISANGGASTAGYPAAGGAGGRVALYLTNNAFMGVVLACGGRDSDNYTANAEHGAAGTVYLKSPSQTNGELIVDNNSLATAMAGASLGASGSYILDKLTLTRQGQLEVADGQALQVLGDPPNIVGDLQNNGTILFPAALTVSNFALVNNNAASLGSLQDLILTNSGSLRHTPNCTAETNRLNVRLRNLTVASGTKVTAELCGYFMYAGPGAYNVATANYNTNSTGRGDGNPLPPYGDAYTPTNLGSGGTSWYGSDQIYGWGGGAIKLKVTGALTVNGQITASAIGPPYYTSGSGGSVWLDVATLVGTGSIRADGAPDGGSESGGSGAGRIAIYYGRSSFTGLPAPGLYTNRQDMSTTVTVKGGYNTTTNGVEDGSIYIEEISQGTLFRIW